MVDLNPYGRKGCTCYPNEDYNPWDDRTAEWLPNASCRFHGVLAAYQPPRNDTGTYRVVRPDDDDQCPPGLHSMFDPCPGGCLNDDEDEIIEPVKCLTHDRWVPCRPCMAEEPGPDADAVTVLGDDPDPCPEGECEQRLNCPRECPVPPDLARAMSQIRALRRPEGVGPADCAWGVPFACRVHCPSTTEEGDRGILATVRRWVRRALRYLDLADD